MLKSGILRIIAALAVAGSVAACNGGSDGGDTYDFGGRWAVTSVVTESTTSVPVGYMESKILVIDQDGESVTVRYEETTTLTMRGSCDPVARTFSATGILDAPPVHILYNISGVGRDDGTMEGTFSRQVGLSRVAGTWTGDLLSR